MIDVLVPTLRRPDRLAPLATNIHDTTTTPHQVVFICEADDTDTRQAWLDGGMWHVSTLVINDRARNYAGAIASGTFTRRRPELSEHVFCAADDVRFHPGWDVAALERMTGEVRVVGTNDLCNPFVSAGTHATHYLVDRRYLDEVGGVVDEGPGSFLFEGYDHQQTDREFCETARARGVFAPCLESVVEHLHWSTGKSEADETTERTVAMYDEDEALFQSRKHLWREMAA